MNEALRLIAIAEVAGDSAWITSDPTTHINTCAQINRKTANQLFEAGLIELDHRVVLREHVSLTTEGWLAYLASTDTDTSRLTEAVRTSLFGRDPR